MNVKRTEGQGDRLHVGQYLVTFDEAGASMEHRSTHACYRVQAATATNAIDFLKYHQVLIRALMGNYPGDLEAYRLQQSPEGRDE